MLREKFDHVLIIEAEKAICQRASYRNQARVHGGYHYPRRFLTAIRSRANSQRFIADYEPAIVDEFTQLYAISRKNSKVTSAQFRNLCERIEAPVRPAAKATCSLFDPEYVESVYVTEEAAFDSRILGELL